MMIGVTFLVLGVLMHYVPWTLNWFGKLPGDLHIKREQSEIYIPFVSMLIVSLLLTLLINLFKRL